MKQGWFNTEIGNVLFFFGGMLRGNALKQWNFHRRIDKINIKTNGNRQDCEVNEIVYPDWPLFNMIEERAFSKLLKGGNFDQRMLENSEFFTFALQMFCKIDK
jgi:hypothetical protein